MRLWHKDLIDVLPRQQLLGQWREWFAIAKNIQEIGTPNHILVNRIMDHGLNDFLVYGFMVYQELKRRGYKVDFSKFSEYMANGFYIRQLEEDPTIYVISGSKIGSSSYTEHVHVGRIFHLKDSPLRKRFIHLKLSSANGHLQILKMKVNINN